MTPLQIILIGFKNAGKSSIGQRLAKKIDRKFIDLDDEIVDEHERKTGEKISPREIMKLHGENIFRKLEHEVLASVLSKRQPVILAVGGGTPVMEANRKLIEENIVIHISAPKSIIFERIMINGKPAFFPKEMEPIDAFQKLWDEREPLFKNLATITVENNSTVDDAVKNILTQLE